MNEEKNEILTGLSASSNPREAEYDLVRSLLEAADYKTQDDAITEVDIRRNGKFLFSVHLHPIGDPDARLARKKATKMMPHPTNKKLPPIEKEFDSSVFNSWIIYLATTEEDQQKVWGNPAVMQKFCLAQPVEGVDVLLTFGEKDSLLETVLDISGMGDGADNEASLEEYAKN